MLLIIAANNLFLLPNQSPGSIDLTGLEKVNWEESFSLPKSYWLDDAEETKEFFEEEVGKDMPKVIMEELEKQKKRIESM